MSQNFVEELARLVDLAPQARVAIDWPAAERELGLQLPSDYKEFAGRFGPGHFQNGYLWIAVPRGVGDRLNFFTSLVQRLEMLRYLRSSGDEIPYPLYPEMGGLIPWGDTIAGDGFHWNTGPDDPNRWTVVANEVRGPGWFEFDGSMTQFLHSILTGRARVPFLHEGIATEPYTFARGEVGSKL